MQDFLLIGAIVIAVWGAVIFWRGGPLGASLALMLVTTCFSTAFFMLEVGTYRLTLDRILWPMVMLQYLIWSRQGWTDPKPLRLADKLLLCFVGYLVLRTFTADWRVNNALPVIHLALWYVMPLGVYWVVRQSPLERRAGLAVLACLTVFGVYLAVTVIAEKFEVYWLVYPKYIITSMAEKNAEFVGRGRGPLLSPIPTGLVLAACWSAALMWGAHWQRARRAILAPLSLMMAVAVYATMTRSVWMGAALSLALVVGAVMPRNWRVPVLGGVMLAALLAAATHWDRIVSFQRDRNLTAKDTEDSVHLRPVLAAVAWNMFQDRPWFGCGFDQYVNEHKYFLDDRSTDLALKRARGLVPHNVLFAILTETGLIGLGMFLAVLAVWGHDAWRLWRAVTAPLWARQQGLLFLATLGAYLVNGMFHYIAYSPIVNLLLFFMAGSVAALQSHVAASEGGLRDTKFGRTASPGIGDTVPLQPLAQPRMSHPL